MLFSIAAVAFSAIIQSEECSLPADQLNPVSLETAISLVRPTRVSQGDFETTEAFQARRQQAIDAVPVRMFVEVPLVFGRDVSYDADEEAFSIIPELRMWGAPTRAQQILGHIEANDGPFGIYSEPLGHLGIDVSDEGARGLGAIGLERRSSAGLDQQGRIIRLGVFERFLEPGLSYDQRTLVDDVFNLGAYEVPVPLEGARRVRDDFEMVVEIWPRYPWLIGPVGHWPTEYDPERRAAYYVSADVRCVYLALGDEVVVSRSTR